MMPGRSCGESGFTSARMEHLCTLLPAGKPGRVGRLKSATKETNQNVVQLAVDTGCPRASCDCATSKSAE